MVDLGVGITFLVAAANAAWTIWREAGHWRSRKSYRELLVWDAIGNFQKVKTFQAVLGDFLTGERGKTLQMFPLNSPDAAVWQNNRQPFLEAGAAPEEYDRFGRFYKAISILENGWPTLAHPRGVWGREEHLDDSTRTKAMVLQKAITDASVECRVLIEAYANKKQVGTAVSQNLFDSQPS